MSKRIYVLAQQIFGKPLDECDGQEIKVLADRYPYFAPAQFLLLEKLKRENSPDYSAQLQKAVLYYHNPLQFEYFISSDRFETEFDLEAGDQSLAVHPEPGQEDSSETTLVSDHAIDTLSSPEIEEREEINVEVPTPEPTEPETPEEPAIEMIDEPVTPEVGLINTVNEESVAEEEVKDSDEWNTEEGENRSFPASVLPEREMSSEVPPVNETTDAADETGLPETGEVSSMQPEAQTVDVAPEVGELAFEPYHTVDYFASQGIRLSQEEVPKDRFGKQLKSFTEWLKTMKRLPASEISKTVDASSESKIQHLAEDSIHDPNVVTEAMAEVWIKQGNKEKAIETYNKLGLLNPSKKAYFAALIENLKRS